MTMKKGVWPPAGYGNRLRQLREQAGIPQADLAERAGCHPMTIAKLERGVQEPAWPLVLALAKALGVDVAAFVVEGEAGQGGRPRGRPLKTRPPTADTTKKKGNRKVN
jgi:transcriptional regulator with XRE-family HTH domain